MKTYNVPDCPVTHVCGGHSEQIASGSFLFQAIHNFLIGHENGVPEFTQINSPYKVNLRRVHNKDMPNVN
jgi:hypothetical protein